MHLAIRADGGPEIGYGHLVRSNALAEEFHSRDHEVTVATTTPQPARSVFPDAVEVIEFPSRGDPEPFLNWLDKNQPDAVFTDSYPVDTEYQRAIRDRVPLAVLQDDDRHAVCADLFINGNLYAPDLDYEFVGDEPKTCLGTDYLLLRKEIRSQITGNASFNPNITSLLVLMGGSDVRNSTPYVLESIGESKYSEEVTAIIGPGYDNRSSIQDTANSLSQPVNCAFDPDNLAEKMLSADLAVTSTGTAVYELLGLQTPFIGVPQIENQLIIGNALKSRNLAKVTQKRAPSKQVVQAIDDTIQDLEFRRRIHRTGPTIVDGLGVKRIAEKIERLVSN